MTSYSKTMVKMLPRLRLLVLAGGALAGLWLPSSTQAAAPVVTNGTVELATGATRDIYLYRWAGGGYGYSYTYTIVDRPQHGTLASYYSYSYYSYWRRYTPDPGYIGTDSFTWCASYAGQTSAVATCFITVITNSPPVAQSFSITVTPEVMATIPLSSRTTHPAADLGQPMAVTITDPPDHGSTYMPIATTVNYASEPRYVGTDTFTWVISDGIATSAPATVTITVPPSVPVVSNQTAIVAKNTPMLIPAQFIGGGGFTCTLIRAGDPSHGTLTVTNGSTFCYVPETNYVGSDLFYWRVLYSSPTSAPTYTAQAICWITVKDVPANPDWTQWRFDECRTAQSPVVLPNKLYLQWKRAGFRVYGRYGDVDAPKPIQQGKTLFVTMTTNDSLAAFDTDTGAEKWRYYASGAVRRPPVALRLRSGQAAGMTNDTDVVIMGSDDGNLYCLNAANGSEVWKFRAAPNSRKAMGYGRLSSVWPIIASPVAYNGKLYFAAGFVPSYALYAYCLDAATGTVLWRNDGRMIFAGCNATLGPIAMSTDHTRLFGTTTGWKYWILDAATGEFIENNWMGSSGTWFIDGKPTIQVTEPVDIIAGPKTYTAAIATQLGVSGTINNMLAGDGKLFVMAGDGTLYCFGGNQVTPTTYTNQFAQLPPVNDGWTTAASNMLSRADLKQGLALVWGVGTGRLAEELAKQTTNLMIVAADPDPAKLKALRVKMHGAGFGADRISTLQGNPMECGFAPYQAGIIASEDVGVAGIANGAAMVQMLYTATRPIGGEIWLPTSDAQHTAIAGIVSASTNLPLCEVVRQAAFTRIKRTGLPPEKLIMKPPYGLTAFGPPTLMIYDAGSSVPSNGIVSGRDIYTWLPLSVPMAGYEPPAPSNNNKVISRFFCVGFDENKLRNPLNSAMEGTPSFYWASACAQGRLYGDMVLGPGKTVCFGFNVDYRGISTFPELGGCCTPSVCIGDGTMVWQSAGGNGSKSCNMLAIGTSTIGITPMEGEESWVNFRNSRSTRTVQETPVKRIGVNFCAPGDRYVAEEALLWTHHPYAGRHTEPTPLLPVTYRGNVKGVYHHSAQMQKVNARDRSWVSASQVTGMDGLTAYLSTPLVALRTTTPPVMDGQLSDTCWDHQAETPFPVYGAAGCTNGGYLMIRYDDTNLYIASRVQGTCGDFVVVLNSRDRRVPMMYFTATNSVGVWPNWFTAEMVIPWAKLEAAGIWKQQLIMNVMVGYSLLIGDSFWNNTSCFTPVYFDAPRGSVTQPKPHTVRLYFAEMEDQLPGQRVFDVKIQGQTVLTNLDVATLSGGSRRELVREFNNIQIANNLDIDFVRKSGEPMVSGLEIIGTYSDSDVTNVSPVAALDASVLSGPTPLAVTLSAKRSYDPDGQIEDCVWETGDGRLARGPAIRHVFAEPGAYKVNLLVTDGQGNTASTNVTITVTKGVPSSFVCKIRASGGDYSGIEPWADAMKSDLLSSSTVFQVTSAGTYSSSDDGSWVTFAGGMSGKLRWVNTNASPMVAAIAYVGGTGTLYAGEVTISSGRTFTIGDTGVAAKSLLFTVSNRGSYSQASDDGRNVTFAGGGVGTLKHINSSNIAYIVECRGTINTGTVTCASGHTFAVSDAGSPVYTIVAEGYNDWPTGLSAGYGPGGSLTDENHCYTIRAAPGQAHKGKLFDASGNYTGFTLTPAYCCWMQGSDYLRLERVAFGWCSLSVGTGASVNRVVVEQGIGVGGNGTIIANSIATTGYGLCAYDLTLYNCTGQSFDGWGYGFRFVNCLSMPGSTGFGYGRSAGVYRSHCVSSDASATNVYLTEYLLGGNHPNHTLTFADSARKDYHLAASDTGARGMGSPGLGSDVDGDERTGTFHDVGADQTAGNHAPRFESGPLATPAAVGTGSVVRFAVAASDLDDNPLTYTWVFGDGNQSNPSDQTDQTHAYNSIGTYTARVVVADGSLSVTGSVVVCVLNSFDAWLIKSFGSTNAPNCAATDDPDRDGMDNLHEYLAGTDPNDSSSVFAIEPPAPVPTTGAFVISWRSVSGQLYSVERSSNLLYGFIPITTGILATPPMNTWTDTGTAGDSGMYRIGTGAQ